MSYILEMEDQMKAGSKYKRRPFLALTISLILFLVSYPLSLFGQSELNLKIDKTVLDNGLTVLTCEDHTVPTVSYQAFVNAGSRDEVKPGITGLAHIFEHMMFRGTEKYPDYDQAVGNYGPQTNAWTGNDCTDYFVDVKAEYLEKVIEIEADRIRNLRFDNETFRTELGPVKEERRRDQVDDPGGFLWERLYELAYQKHTYHHPVIGWEEDLEKNIQVGDGLEFKKTFYSPGYCIISIAGNFNTDEVVGWIKKYYGDWPAQPRPHIEIPQEPSQTEERVRDFVWKDSQISPRLLIGYHGPNANVETNDFAVLKIMAKILFLGSGRLTKKLYQDLQLVDQIWGDIEEHKDPGLFVISANLKRDKSIDQVKSIIFEEIDKLRQEQVTPEELEKAKNSLKADLLYSLDYPHPIAGTIGFSQVVGGDYNLFLKLQEKYEQITAKDVQEVASRIFLPTNRTVVTLMPKI
jgi:zinc protease